MVKVLRSILKNTDELKAWQMVGKSIEEIAVPKSAWGKSQKDGNRPRRNLKFLNRLV